MFNSCLLLLRCVSFIKWKTTKINSIYKSPPLESVCSLSVIILEQIRVGFQHFLLKVTVQLI